MLAKDNQIMIKYFSGLSSFSIFPEDREHSLREDIRPDEL